MCCHLFKSQRSQEEDEIADSGEHQSNKSLAPGDLGEDGIGEGRRETLFPPSGCSAGVHTDCPHALCRRRDEGTNMKRSWKRIKWNKPHPEAHLKQSREAAGKWGLCTACASGLKS